MLLARLRNALPGKRMMALGAAIGVSLAGISAYTATSAFGDTGSLTGRLSVVSSGSRPFDNQSGPGLDESPIDDVVRSNDLVIYRVDTSAEGAVNGTTIRMQAQGPAKWQTPPSLCGGYGSGVSGDGKTLTCNIGRQTNQTNGVELVLRVTGDAPNGAKVTASATVKGDGVPSVQVGQAVVAVSASPRWDVSAIEGQPLVVGGARDGAYGNFVSFPITVLHRGPSVRGLEALNPQLTFSVDTSRLYADAPAGVGGWQLVGCYANGFEGPAFPNLPNMNELTPVQRVDCVRAGTRVNVTLDGLNTSLIRVPSKSAAGLPLPIENTYAFAGKLVFFVPEDDIAEHGDPEQGVHSLRMRYSVSPLTTMSISGQPNLGDIAADNVAEAEVTNAAAGEFGIVYGSAIAGGDATMIAPGRESPLDRKGKITPGTAYSAQVISKNLGDTPHGAPGRVCDIFDKTGQQVTGVSSAIYNDAGGMRIPIPGAHIEWGVGNTPAGPASGCADGDAVWKTELAEVPGGPSAVDRVRWIVTSPQPVATYYRFIVEKRIKDGTPDGTEVRSWGRATWAGRRDGAEIKPALDDSDAIGGMSDRMVVIGSLARVTVRTATDSDPVDRPSDQLQAAQPGEVIRFVVQSTLTDSTGGVGRECPIQLALKLPNGLSMMDGSATVPLKGQRPASDGSTQLTWDLGNQQINGKLPVVELKAKVGTGLMSGQDLSVNGTISSKCDMSPEEQRSSTRALTVSGQAAYRIVQEITPPVAAVGDEITFALKEFNAWSGPIRATDLITRVPRPSDKSGTDVEGPVRLRKVVPGSPDAVIRYTTAPTDTIDLDADDPSNQPGGATKWCGESELGSSGCPARREESTGIRVAYPQQMGPNSSRVTKVIVDAPQSEEDDKLGNVFGSKADGLALPVRSNLAAARLVAGSIGGEVWRDADRDGTDDAGELNVAGVKVRLSGQPESCTLRTTETLTGPDGTYLFDDLCPGSYSVTFEPPPGMAFTIRDVGAEAADSDPDGTGKVQPRSLSRMFRSGAPSQLLGVTDDVTVDAGLVDLTATPTQAPGGNPSAGPTPPTGTVPTNGPDTGVGVNPTAGTSPGSAPGTSPGTGTQPTAGTLPGTGTGVEPTAKAGDTGASPGTDVGSGATPGTVTPTLKAGTGPGNTGTDPTDDGTDSGEPQAAPGSNGGGGTSPKAGGSLATTGTPSWVRTGILVGLASVVIGSLLLVVTLRSRLRREPDDE